MPTIAYLECSKCGERISAETPQTVCPKDAGSLYVRYDLQAMKRNAKRQELSGRVASMWRYRDVLPDVTPVTLGEGFTP
ncbi:MAG TPA: threonine synthase, partial [Terriglobales bacterium]